MLLEFNQFLFKDRIFSYLETVFILSIYFIDNLGYTNENKEQGSK